MSGIVTKGLIGKEDQSIQESGYPATFDRVNSMGGTSTMTKFPNLWKYFYKVHTVRYHGSSIDSTTINAAISAIGTEKCILVIPKEDTNWAVNANIAFPATMRVRFEEGAVLAQGGAFTVTFGCQPIIEPDQQVFSGFAAGDITGLSDPYGEWWGASPSATAAVNYSAITCALASITTMGTAWLGNGVFVMSDTIIIDGRYLVCRTLRGQGRRNTWLLHTGNQSTGAVIIKGGGYSNSLPVYGNTGGNVRDIALGSLGGTALTFSDASRCFDTRDIFFFSAKSTAEYLLISGDSGMNHIEDITDGGNDTVPASVTALSPDYPLYGIRLEKGTGTYGPMENKIVRPRIEYTRDAALQVDLSYEENIFESVKFGSGRTSGPAINIVDGPIKITGMNYIEKYGSGTVGVNLDNKTGAPALTVENLEMGAQSIDLGTYGDTGTNLVSLDIRGSNFLDIRNSVPAYIDVLNVISCRSLTSPTWMPRSGSYNIYGNRYWNTGAGAYQIFRGQESIVAHQTRAGVTTKVTGVGAETSFTPGASKAITFSFDGAAAIVLISNAVSGAAGYALVSYASSTITLVTGSDAQFVNSASPTADQIGLSKGANSSTVTVTTGSNISGAIGVTVLGQDITAVTDPS